MKALKIYIIFFTILAITSCHSSRNISYRSSNTHTSEKRTSNKEANDVLKTAHKYLGTPYKYGGTSKSGLDCSGLIINAFDAVGIQMPRISRDQASEGKEIRLREIKEGDLVFFKTSGSGISHVGIVDDVKNGTVFFIHASTSKGVIISSLDETYWNKRFVKATRIL